MMDPVVSSKYGKRPLLDMPALHVESDSRVEISSLQARVKPDFGVMPSMIYRPGGLAISQPLTAPTGMPGLSAQPPALPMYQQQPATFQPPAMLPPQMMGAAPIQPQPMYPAMQPSYQGQGYYNGGGGGGAMMAPAYPQPVPVPRTPVPANFHLEGVLQYGQLTTLHFRDRNSNFQGLPEYLRNELLQTYGKYPVTDIRIVAMNGQYHIYATPRRGEDGDDMVSEYGGPVTPDTRMIGFNEVRGEPRELLPARVTRFKSM